MQLNLRITTVVVLIIILSISIKAYSQDYSIVINKGNTNTRFGGKASFKISQAYFSKWAAGGQDLINYLGNLVLASRYINSLSEWENTINLIYGSQSLEHKEFRKTDDGYEFNSKYGLKTEDPRLLISLALQFKSQFAKGFTYDNNDIASLASAPFAPAYLIGYLGLDYKPIIGLSIFLSPFTSKTTIVANKVLSDQGAYGLNPGSTLLQAYGANLTVNVNKKLMKNFNISSKLDLFSNYKHVSSVVVNWDNSLDFNINNLIVVSLSTSIIYDENIKWKETATINGEQVVVSNKPQVQYKQLLSIGMQYTL